MSDSTTAVAHAGIVAGVLLWVIGSVYAGFNGGLDATSVVWLMAWVLLPVSVGVHAGVTAPDRPMFTVGMTLVSAAPILGVLPACYYLGYTHDH